MKLAQTFYAREERETIKTRLFTLRVNPPSRDKTEDDSFQFNRRQSRRKESPKLNISTTIYRGNLLWLAGKLGMGRGGGSQKIPTRPRFATFVIRCFTGTGLGEFAVNWVDVITQIAVKPYSPVYETHNREWYSPLNATCHGLFTSSFSLNCTETSVYTTEYKIVLDIARFEEKEDEAKHVSRPCVPSDCQEIW